MTEAMYRAILTKAGCEKGKDGVMTLPENRTLTFHLSNDGAQLSVARVVALSLSDGVVTAEDHKGEVFLLSIEDIFAASISGEGNSGGTRKAGFLG
ncbi:MAG: hypothetical protein R3B72_25835 [Polyangiaceae bacterium]